MHQFRIVCLFALLAGPLIATAAVQKSAADGFLIAHAFESAAPAARIYVALSTPARWWDPAHTWSGDAANLSLEARVGGCFCERWGDRAAEHLRVVWAAPPTELRLQGGLGPLQEMGVAGVLRYQLRKTDTGTRVELSYRVSGDSLHELPAIAPAVDAVLVGQMSRLQRYLDTGSPAAAD